MTDSVPEERSAGITIRLLGPADAAALGRVAEGVFDAPVNPEWAQQFLDDTRHHMAAAVDSRGRIVGIASAVHYLHPDKAPQLWINEVGVAPEHQRKGLGRRLIDCLLEQAGTLGCLEAWVLTDHDNEAARGLYRSAGGSEAEGVVMVDWSIPKAGD